MVRPEMYGFDEQVDVIIQEKEKYVDVDKTHDKYTLPKLYTASFSHRYYIPAEYAVYIAYAPIKNNESRTYKKSPMGKFRVRAML